MQTLRGIFILFVFLVTALAIVPWQSSAIRLKLGRRKTLPNRYSRFLCKLFGLNIIVIGKPEQDRGVLMVANHTSYLDIIVLGGTARVSFVAKSEVSTWPFFGLMARLYETVFVERSRRSQAGVARDQLRERLQAGDALVLFPEGTSNDGNRVLPFKSALMGAVEAEVGTDAKGKVQHVPVQPVSISYVGFHGMPMGRENRPALCLVRRHGAGAASVGSRDRRSDRRRDRISLPHEHRRHGWAQTAGRPGRGHHSPGSGPRAGRGDKCRFACGKSRFARRSDCLKSQLRA